MTSYFICKCCRLHKTLRLLAPRVCVRKSQMKTDWSRGISSLKFTRAEFRHHHAVATVQTLGVADATNRQVRVWSFCSVICAFTCKLPPFDHACILRCELVVQSSEAVNKIRPNVNHKRTPEVLKYDNMVFNHIAHHLWRHRFAMIYLDLCVCEER